MRVTMQTIDIQATARTPLINFKPEEGLFVLEGESYPEDTKKFYDTPLSHVYSYLAQTSVPETKFVFKLRYFNSSSAKVLMDLFVAIEEAAIAGNSMIVEWHHAEDDDNMQELGEEFSEELQTAKFVLVTF
jgi:SiaC family regulatory phosphoprotein